MGSNQRKVYGDFNNDHGEAGAKPCPHCGCRHRYTIRAFASSDRARIVRICRHCGFETVENA